MSAPTDQSLKALKRLGRYLGGRPRLVYTYRRQEIDTIDVYVDTDWAGCVRTRKSTSGGAVMLGKHTIKHWSSTQPSVSLSSGEAEFYGVVRGAGQGLGYQALLKDLGIDIPLRMWTDSPAALGICEFTDAEDDHASWSLRVFNDYYDAFKASLLVFCS